MTKIEFLTEYSNHKTLLDYNKAKVLEYAEKETIEETKKILEEITIECEILGVNKNEKYKKLDAKITIRRKQKEINFIFHFSHNHAELYEKINASFVENNVKEEWRIFKEYIYYLILCDCGTNLLADISSFSNFCVEFDYNEDSIKDRELFIFCGEHKTKLLKIFKESEAKFLPN